MAMFTPFGTSTSRGLPTPTWWWPTNLPQRVMRPTHFSDRVGAPGSSSRRPTAPTRGSVKCDGHALQPVRPGDGVVVDEADAVIAGDGPASSTPPVFDACAIVWSMTPGCRRTTSGGLQVVRRADDDGLEGAVRPCLEPVEAPCEEGRAPARPHDDAEAWHVGHSADRQLLGDARGRPPGSGARSAATLARRERWRASAHPSISHGRMPDGILATVQPLQRRHRHDAEAGHRQEPGSFCASSKRREKAITKIAMKTSRPGSPIAIAAVSMSVSAPAAPPRPRWSRHPGGHRRS